MPFGCPDREAKPSRSGFLCPLGALTAKRSGSRVGAVPDREAKRQP